jgi:shikimate dehydrogenase
MALLDAGVERLEVFDQSPTKAQALKTRLTRDDDFGKIHLLADLPALYANPPDGIVNATPMGMTNYPGVAVEIESLPPRVWVSDIVYFPIQTELLRRARQHGCRVMNGSAMAVGQAVEAFRLFTGQQPDAARMAQSFADMLASSSSD